MRQRDSFTLIELLMVIAIIGILSVSGAYLMAYLVQNSVFIPNQLNMDMLASDALDIMIEGDGLVKGLRFSRAIANIQDNGVIFVNQDGQIITYRLDSPTHKLFRSIAGAGETPLPYYSLSSAIEISGKNNKLFIYYDADNRVTTNRNNVRRIEISLIAKTGSGSYKDWQGQSEQSSSVAVKRFQTIGGMPFI